jgi:small GTP-binding protein
MREITKLIEIAGFLHETSIEEELSAIENKLAQEDKSLVMPLVGEFSAGKTSLINALINNKVLETASSPTTATIFEIYFGCSENGAEIVSKEGNIIQVENIVELQNDKLEDIPLVRVYDTSDKVPSSLVLVDTPGISSHKTQHINNLVSYLPLADAILLVTDINQQLTRSMLDFIEMSNLSKRKIFLIVTKCDTKTDKEILEVKQYISKNIKLNLDQIVCVSAIKNDISELSDLFDKIQTIKEEVFNMSLEYRLDNIAKSLSSRADELIANASSDTSIEDKLKEQQRKLDGLNRNIDKLLQNSSNRVEEILDNSSGQFRNIIENKLDAIVVSNTDNYDTLAKNAVNNTADLIFKRSKNEIVTAIMKLAHERKGTSEEVDFISLEKFDLDELPFGDLNYALDLTTMGHAYDKTFATGLKILAAAAAVAAIVYTAGAAAPAVTGTAATGTTGTVAAETAGKTIVASGTKAAKAAKLIKRIGYVKQGAEQLKLIEDVEKKNKEARGTNKGIAESIAGFATDKLLGKPQRKRAINEYIDEYLMPDFKSKMGFIRNTIENTLSSSLHEDAAERISQMKQMLGELNEQKRANLEEYNKRISTLRNYQSYLQQN